MILIKHYPNRKFYDTRAKQYITLERIASLLFDGEEIEVRDHVTGEDLTTRTLLLSFLKQDKKQGNLYPLLELIRVREDRNRKKSGIASNGITNEGPFQHQQIISHKDLDRLAEQIERLAEKIEQFIGIRRSDETL